MIPGAGGLGLYAAAVGNDLGAEVVMVEGIPERIELAKRFGAAHIVDLREHATSEERVEVVQRLTDGYGADVVLEVAGVPAAFVEALHLARPGGDVIEIGNVNVGPEHEVSVSPGLITRKNRRVQGMVRYQPWYLHRAWKFLERKLRSPLRRTHRPGVHARRSRRSHRAGRGPRSGATGHCAELESMLQWIWRKGIR